MIQVKLLAAILAVLSVLTLFAGVRFYEERDAKAKMWENERMALEGARHNRVTNIWRN
jgi:membrane protein implicated in regulation of membrane protease activity